MQVSTDEVYGSLKEHDPPVVEEAALAPNNPYAASKAGADLMVRAYARTFGVPALITRASNTFGPYQFPEKLIPLLTIRALHNEPLPVFGDGMNRRRWIHADDHAAALWAVCTRGDLGQLVYNIGGDTERTNIEIARRVVALLGKSEDLDSVCARSCSARRALRRGRSARTKRTRMEANARFRYGTRQHGPLVRRSRGVVGTPAHRSVPEYGSALFTRGHPAPGRHVNRPVALEKISEDGAIVPIPPLDDVRHLSRRAGRRRLN